MKRLLFIPVIALASLPVLAQAPEEGAAAPEQPPSELGATPDDEIHQPADEAAPASGEDWVRDFSEADKDGDGFLSAVEARDALPSHVLVVDTDNDGQLSKTEVQNAVPGLSFEEGGEAGADSRIGAREYDAIVQAIEEGGEEREA